MTYLGLSVSQWAFIFLAGGGAWFLLRKFGRALGGLLIVVCLVGASVWALAHSFQAFNSTTLVAKVQATPIVNAPHTMAVDFTAYNSDGTVKQHSMYELQGDRWEMNCSVVRYWDWVNYLGISSGYSCDRITSQYDDGQAHNIQPVELPHGQTFAIPFLERTHYRNGVLEPADNVKYNVYCTLQGQLYAQHA